MRTSLALTALCALVAVASATINPEPHVIADKEFLLRQKKLLEVFWHVGQPTIDPEQKKISETFKLEDNFNNYKNPELAKKFVNYYNHGYFKARGEKFNIYDKLDQIQAKALVDLLYQANDFETFYKTSVWARDHLNEGLFVYALNVAKLHREDLFDVVLPPFYELYPQLYVGEDVIKEAWEATLQGKTFSKENPYVIRVNYSGQPFARNADELVSYYTEDVSLNAYLDFMHYRYPFWAKMPEYNQANYTRRGDHFYYGLKATLTRYNLERLSNNLPDVEAIDYTKPINGYVPQGPLVQYVSTLEKRLLEAIDSGFVFDGNFTKYSLRDPLNIELLGRIVEGNADSLNKEYYGSYYRSLLSLAVAPNSVTPATTFSNPTYYKVCKRVADILDKFKEKLGPYSKEQLLLPGVKVESLTIDKLVTFFDDYDFELNNAIPVGSVEEGGKLNVLARTQRLTHKPFNYHIKVTSDKDIDVFVRFFIGPRYDVYGKELTLSEKRNNMLYTDSFIFKLKKGENELVRNSRQFNFYGQLPLGYTKLYHRTEAAIKSSSEVYVDDFVKKYGDPEGLILPRGTRSGLPINTYVIITPFTHTTISRINPYTDDIGAKISLFPFDRPINEIEFNVPNSYLGDAIIVHRSGDEVIKA